MEAGNKQETSHWSSILGREERPHWFDLGNCRMDYRRFSHYDGEYISVLFPTLTSKNQHLVELGDVDLLFAGKVKVGGTKKGVPADLPIIAFPHCKGCSKIMKGTNGMHSSMV